MSKDRDFPEIFGALKKILEPYASKMIVVKNSTEEYYLDTKHVNSRNKKPVFFGAVKTGKNYVSFHLMPVYSFPKILALASPELLRRMQGKSCFNFKAIDRALFAELAGLTKFGYERYEQEGWITGPQRACSEFTISRE